MPIRCSSHFPADRPIHKDELQIVLAQAHLEWKGWCHTLHQTTDTRLVQHCVVRLEPLGHALGLWNG